MADADAGPGSCICRIRSHVPNTLSDGIRSMHAKVEKRQTKRSEARRDEAGRSGTKRGEASERAKLAGGRTDRQGG